MKLIRFMLGAACLCGVPTLAIAADHIDAPAAKGEPGADITDVYAWMSDDSSKLNLVLDVNHMATESTMFSNALQYALHINSSKGYGMPQTESTLVCQFYTASKIECWLGKEYVEGDPRDPKGIVSESGKLRVFAGLRDDPFFFELAGFKETVKLVEGAASGLTFDVAGCPAVDSATSQALVAQLQHGASAAPASNSFAGNKILAFAVQMDKSLVTGGGNTLGVWASTHAATK